MSAPHTNFYDLPRTELLARAARWGFPTVHAARLWAYVYLEGVEDWRAMPELPARFLTKAEQELRFPRLATAAESHSADGFTRKYLLSLADGRRIETVLMRYTGRVTACISSQVGCAMGCVFCATGQMGYVRHLTPGEIVAQAMHVDAVLRDTAGSAPPKVGRVVPDEPKRSAVHPEDSPNPIPPLARPSSPSPHERHERLRNIVLMGMGEPLHNYDAVMTAIDILRDPSGLALGAKKITLSTVGVVPGIIRLADEQRPVHLAVSLHGATQEERAALVPAAKKWPLDELMAACRYYIAKQQRRIFYEWTLIEGKNDTPGNAHAVGRLLRGQEAQVNLIPLNPTAGFAGEPTGRDAAKKFQSVLAGYGLPSTIRQRRGIDIAAGCGQLAVAKK
ncbi:MAG: 23S rRNA (adenine(2503)-C(2))-methyltransferase RlmN [Opitutae bacterium]|nr:23S rRNA (adenine(2503)-C(2))-methyltransferase RlmN [Opitutae bacterium]